MEEGLDTGPVYAMRQLTSVRRRLPPICMSSLRHWRPRCSLPWSPGLPQAHCAATPQPDEGVTYARKLARGEGRLDFAEPADMIERRLRALNPAPGCWCEARGERLGLLAGRVVAAAGVPGTIVALPLTDRLRRRGIAVTQVQRAGKRPMSPDELQRGFALPVGTVLG